jgi:DNA mismatch repair protein MutS
MNIYFCKNSRFISKVLFIAFGINIGSSLLAVVSLSPSGKDVHVEKADVADELFKKSVYSKISDLHMPSLRNLEAYELDNLQKVKVINERALKDKSLKGVHVPAVGDVEKLRIAYQIFGAYGLSKGDDIESKHFVANDNVFTDLDVYCGPIGNFGHNIFSQIDKTKTCFGRTELQRFLYQSFNDIDELKQKIKNRQAIVKYLVENPDVFAEIDSQLDLIKNNEADLLWFWKRLDKAVTDFFSQAYFQEHSFLGLAAFNESSKMLGATSLNKIVGIPTACIIWPLFIVAPALIFSQYKWSDNVDLRKMYDDFIAQDDDARKALLGIWDDLIRENPDVVPNFFESNYLSFSTKYSLKLLLKYYEWLMKAPVSIFSNDGMSLKGKVAVGAVWAGYITLAHLLPLFLSIREAKNYNDLTNLIQDKMISVAAVTNSAYALGSIIESNPQLEQAFGAHILLQKNIDGDGAEVNVLLDELKKDTFKDESSLLSNKGRVLASFKKMFRLKGGVVGALKSVGELDAYMSIAKLYLQNKDNKNARYCFAQIVDSDKPYINAKGFWHPFIAPEKVVTNDIELGGNTEPHNVILTGPNAAGKSTFLKSFAWALFFANTFGMTTASSFEFTPFAQFNTYLNIADEEGKASLFQAEMHRAQQLLNSIKSLGNGQFSFVIMDEIFTGTNPEEGQSGAYAVAKNIAKYSSCICVVATHYKKLTELEADTNGYYKNYKVYVNKRADGTIECPYKVIPGISDQAIALMLLQQEGFDREIVDEAFDVLDGIQKDAANRSVVKA